MAEITTTDMGDLEELIVSKLDGDDALVSLLGGKYFYADAEKPADNGGRKTIVVFNVTPLGDKNGQTRRINSKALVDLKVVIDGPPDDTSEAAVARIDALFEKVTKERKNNHSVSMVSKRAIRYREPLGGDAERAFYHRGRSYTAWIARAY